MIFDDISMYMQDFSVTATLNGSALVGIFDNASVSVLTMLGGSNPIFQCAEADLGSVDPRGQTLVVNSISYIVRENKPDGNGMTQLELDKQ